MKIYVFCSGSISYYTTSKSLRKAQQVGKENWKHYLSTCDDLGIEPGVDYETFFKVTSVDPVDLHDFLLITDDDTLLLDDELYSVRRAGAPTG